MPACSQCLSFHAIFNAVKGKVKAKLSITTKCVRLGGKALQCVPSIKRTLHSEVRILYLLFVMHKVMYGLAFGKQAQQKF